MDNKQLPAVVQGNFQIQTMEDAVKMGDLFVKAGLFEVTDKEAQAGMTPDKKQAIAAVKIIAGASMGLSAYAAMSGLHVIKGKITQSYQTMLAMVRKTPGYDYSILKNETDIAKIEFFRNGKSLGISVCDEADIKRAQLGGNPNHQKFPKQMKLARATTMGVNAFCPEVLEGPSYTPEDFGEVVDVSSGEDEASETPDPKQKAAPSAKATKETGTSPASATTTAQLAKASTTTTTKDTTSTSTATAPPASLTPTDENVTDVEEVSEQALGGRPDPEKISDIMQAGSNNGWTEEQLDEWLTQFFADNGVDVTSPDTVFETWTWDHLENAISYVSQNQPR